MSRTEETNSDPGTKKHREMRECDLGVRNEHQHGREVLEKPGDVRFKSGGLRGGKMIWKRLTRAKKILSTLFEKPAEEDLS